MDTLSRLDSGWHEGKDGINLKQVNINNFKNYLTQRLAI